jgi:Plasmid stabilization system protein
VARLVFAPQAVEDISGVLTSLTERAGQRVADNYTDQFRSAFERLAAHPLSGGPRPRFGRNVRVTVVRPYIVIYRAQADDVVILRVMHGRRKITRRTVTERTDPS